jgi:hypothetical protein
LINKKGMKTIKSGGYRGIKSRIASGEYMPSETASKQVVAIVMLEDYDAACMVAEQTETMEECVERCKQILVLKGELP